MPIIYIGIGYLVGVASIFGLITIAVDAQAKENIKRWNHEERDSFMRCQVYLDRGDQNEKDYS